jgi:putative component of toxin-antitoxin plasmid stabilization module
MELGNTSNVKWFAGIGESLIVLFGGGTKRRQQADIERAKALHVEYKKRKR